MHTLESLQARIWYRLLKVLWVGAFALTFIAGFLLILHEQKARQIVDPNRTEVLCVVDADAEAFGGLGDPSDEFAQYACAFNKLTKVDRVLSRRPLSRTGVFLMVSDFADPCPTDYVRDKLRTVCTEDKRGTHPIVIPVYGTEGGALDVAKWTALLVLCLVFVFESGRRLFYYVLLGTWRPAR